MKILHFYKTYYPDTFGGVENVIHQIAQGVAAQGIQSKVLSLSPRPQKEVIELEGYSVHQVKLNFKVASTGFSLAAFSRFAELAKEADLIHYHYPWPFADLLDLILKIKKPSLVTYHSDIVRQKIGLKFYKKLQYYFLQKTQKIIATSPNYLESSQLLNQHRDKTVVIPLGIEDTKDLNCCSKTSAAWKNTLGEKFFLFIGVLRYYKGLEILLEAAKNKAYPVVIVGSGPMERSLKAQAKRLKLWNVHFLGTLSNQDKHVLLQLCTAVVFPSYLRSEAFGLFLLEGAMYGKPMISTEIGTGTSYVNQHEETGLIVPPHDSTALANAMDLIWNNSQFAKEMGIQARKRYLSLFRAEQMVEKYADVYQSLMAEHD